ncbi:hypothetical protein FY528_08645 [Hymenobacter lutimineralis]|uniref:Uncharacterized protein n=1 Tax=Hymenobacter lutimineralis TaxID=2606448 RepID=A0A5D6V4J1_9BACT|nr:MULTISPECIES: hypothetical protein [Hymenobacter]QIX63036.1 hypothetical protein HER32_18395 [Hymenobacter sp. BT18]TYZ10526.1 hypothetical protein FY528_08645 [Hymenobacter lutimineralis]
MQVILSLWLGFLAGYNPSTTVLQPSTLRAKPGYTLQISTKAAFDKAHYLAKPSIVMNWHNVTVSKKSVRIKLSNGKAVSFVGKPAEKYEVDQEEFSYAGSIAAIHKCLVRCQYWESSRTYIVDQQSGRVDTLWGTPALSSDLTRMASLYAGWGMEEINGVQIYKMVNGRVKPLITIDQQDWIPIDLCWSGSQVVLLKVVPAAVAEKEAGQLARLPASKYKYLQLTIR